MIVTSLAMTFHAALEALSRVLTQFIWVRPRKSRGWFHSAHAGATASPQGWSLRYWRWSMTISSTVRPNARRR
jgi:hypothetical protein